MLALVIGLALVVPALLNQCRGPEVVLREYLDALVAGDTATLREHTSTDRVTGTAAMTDPIYSAATDRVQDYEILDLRTEGTAATATVQLDNGTEKHESTLSLTGRSENFYSPLQWRMDPVAYGEVTLAKPPDAEEISVNGTMLGTANLHRTAADGHSEPVLQLLPVTYEVILPANGELVTPVPTEIAVAPSLGVDAPSVAGRPLRYDITEAGRQEVERQVVGRLEECAATAQALQPDHCPFAVPVGEREVGRPPGGAWEILEQLQLEITSMDYGGMDMVGTGGRARFTPDAGSDGIAEEPITVDFDVLGLVVQDPNVGLHAIVMGVNDPYSVVVCYDAETGESSLAVDLESGVTDCG